MSKIHLPYSYAIIFTLRKDEASLVSYSSEGLIMDIESIASGNELRLFLFFRSMYGNPVAEVNFYGRQQNHFYTLDENGTPKIYNPDNGADDFPLYEGFQAGFQLYPTSLEN